MLLTLYEKSLRHENENENENDDENENTFTSYYLKKTK